ncbi:isoprenoid synthase domain-containing protein [Lipomyces tetrasporus]|uniref:Isoprenoid synthase domain-containing protein n=1 Tax=Lipomyces tetrasporus TaxID=54092 RepID=A0AAD7QQX7_9ASCO|nr:isoprenoid synthase domain-containing protein [Lipomyces tetrasporus]KAJ8099366.1 isoprenoid synthase domain-containing protein [Lipomyces tetrasporus]
MIHRVLNTRMSGSVFSRNAVRNTRRTTRVRVPATIAVTGYSFGVQKCGISSSSRTDSVTKGANASGTSRIENRSPSVASLLGTVFSAPAKVASVASEAFARSTSAERSSIPGSKAFSDPLSVVAAEMTNLTNNIRSLLGSAHPNLDTAAKYYVQSQGKHIRPLLVLLMSRAVLRAPKSDNYERRYNVDESISPLDILRDFNPTNIISSIATTVSRSPTAATEAQTVEEETGIFPSQRRLAEITEMIHAASLLHDDVIDDAELRRGNPSGNSAFGNKMAILAGDFLLGRASVALARLRNAEVTELISTVIANLVEGEVMQLKNTAPEDAATGVATPATFDYYLEKTYLKTASLISKSCRSAAVLAGAREDIVENAYQYGRNLGMAFQLVDDLLDYTVTESDLGKPAGADLQLGLATAPALFAWKHYPELGPMIRRKFSQPGDVEKARQLVSESDGVEKTRQLAKDYSDNARKAVAGFPESTAKDALIDMTATVLNRKN